MGRLNNITKSSGRLNTGSPAVVQTINGKPSLAMKPVSSAGQVIINAQVKKAPLGFVGSMTQAALNAVTDSAELAGNKITNLFESLFAADKKAVATAKLNPLSPDYLSKPSTPIQRAAKLGEAGLSVAGLAFLPVTTQLEAAKELPGYLSIPAKIASGIFEDLGRLGSATASRGIGVLPVSDETKEAIRPFSEELGAFITQLVGIKMAHRTASGAVNFKKLPISEKAKGRLETGTKLATGFSVTPFTTAYGLVNARIAAKVSEKQQANIEITPEVGKQIVEEVRQEIQTQGLPDLKLLQIPTRKLLEAPAEKYVSGEGFVMTDKVSKPKAERSKLLQDYQKKLKSYNQEPTKTRLSNVLKAKEKITAFDTTIKTTEIPELKTAESRAVEQLTTNLPKQTVGISKPATDINAKLAEQGLAELPKEKLAQYTPVTKAETVKTVSEIMADKELAKRIATGKEESRLTEVERQVLFNSLEKEAIEKGDYQTLMELAKSPIATERSLAGQTLGSSAWEKDSVIKNIQEAIRIKEENYEAKTGKKVDKAKKEAVDEIKEEIRKSEPKAKDWTSFIESIKCK